VPKISGGQIHEIEANGVLLSYGSKSGWEEQRDLIHEARARGIEPPFDEQTVHEELGK
jgi:hypothetical protein